jgi:hypothetical protein
MSLSATWLKGKKVMVKRQRKISIEWLFGEDTLSAFSGVLK